jgi:predicted phage-related endonuclease
MISDIRRMVDFITAVMIEKETFDNFPRDLLEKYSKVKLLDPLTNVDEKDRAIFDNLLTIREEIKRLDSLKKDLEDHIKAKFDIGVYIDDNIDIKIAEYSKSGGIDTDALLMDHPDIDIKQYTKPPIVYRTITTKTAKRKTTN